MVGGGEMEYGMGNIFLQWKNKENIGRKKKMSEMKNMIALFESYDNLPNGKLKEEIKEDMNKIKELLHYEHYKLAKSVFETDQLDELVDNNPDDGSWKGR